MKYLTINEKRMNKSYLRAKIREVYVGGKIDIRDKRGQTQIYFRNNDLTEDQAIRIAKKLGMAITSKSSVRAVMGY